MVKFYTISSFIVELSFFRDYVNYTEILDLFICSSSMFKTIKSCEVCIEMNLFSDHYPVKIELKNSQNVNANNIKRNELNYTRANWNKFKCILEQVDIKEILKSEDPDRLNDFIITNINKAAK